MRCPMAYDFRVQSNITRHPKFLELRDRCGDVSLWCVMDLWGYATEYRPDGDLSGLSDRSLERVASWTGEPGALMLALVDVGLVDGEPMSRSLHDWQTRQAYIAARAARQEGGSAGGKNAAAGMTPEQRSERARNAALAKVAAKVDAKVAANSHPIPSHPQPIDQNTPSISPVTGEVADAGTGPASPRSAGNKGEPKEKKERTATPKAAINHSITFDPATFTLHGITDADRAQWQGYAPGVDVDTEIDAFLDYMQTHPEALQRTLKTGAWKAAINTRFRNAAKYGATMTKAKRPDAERDPFAGKLGDVGQPPKPKPLAIKPSSEFDWPATKKILESTLEPDLYARWIEPLTYEGMSERGAVLAAADQYDANYVKYNLRDPLGDAILVAHGLAVPFCCLSRSGLAGAGS